MSDRHSPPQYSRGYAQLADDVATAKPGSPISFVVSTPGVKRDGLDLRASGWRLDRYRRAPSVLWCHERTGEPIGIGDPNSDGQRLTALITFDQEDDRARRIESKVRRGFLRATSVGWDFVDEHGGRLDSHRMSPDRLRDHAFYDLTEISIVPVPADPDALVIGQRAALRTLGRELVDLYDEQEHGAITAGELRRAVIAELNRLGVPIPRHGGITVDEARGHAGNAPDELGDGQAQPADSADSAEPASETEAAETEQPAADETPQDSAAERAAGIDETAARALLAAFRL